MYHYDPATALEELMEDAVLPHPSHLRDMIVRAGLGPERTLELNRQFQDYIHRFGELQALLRPIVLLANSNRAIAYLRCLRTVCEPVRNRPLV